MAELTRYELLHGRDEPPAEVVELRAGPLTAELENGDLRGVQWGSVEIVRRLGVAVRDVNWDTPAGHLTPVAVERGTDSFRVTFGSRHVAGDLDYEWQALIEGRPDGTITYSMDGALRNACRYSRIGFDLLHPLEGHRGARYIAQEPRGVTAGHLPDLIAPEPFEDGIWHPCVGPYSALRIRLTNGAGEVAFGFEGDLFEMEDQRNWTDASLKTFCTPLSLGYPFDAEAGKAFHQRVTVSFLPDEHAAREPGSPTSGASICVGEPVGRLPALGFRMASHGRDLTQRESQFLRALRPDHLRVDLHLETGDAAWEAELARAQRGAADLGCALEVAVFLSDDGEAELAALAPRIAGTPVVRYLVFHDAEASGGTTPARWVVAARRHLAAVSPGAAFAGGAVADFMTLNWVRPRAEVMDAVCYPVCPQAHAFDDRSVMRTIEAQPETIATAGSFAAGRPIAISTVTLRLPFNPYALEESATGPAALPPTVDPRQMSLFAAAWTTGSLAALAEAGAASVTWFETTGWQGLMETEDGPPLPDLFRSRPGMVFPVYHVFAGLAPFSGADVLRCASSAPDLVRGIALQREGRRRLLVANLAAAPQRVTVGPFGGPAVLARILDEAIASMAALDPGAFRATPASEVRLDSGTAVIELGAYAVATLDEMGAGARD